MSDSEVLLGHVTAHWAQASHLGVWYQESCDSTNQIAKEQAFDEDSKKQSIRLYLTDNQEKGRGRSQNEWLSPPKGTALLSSWSFQVANPPQPVLSPLIGLSIFRAFFSSWPMLPWSLKAPNDLYLADKKVGGILIENIQEADKNRLIIGFGLNVLGYPDEIKDSGCLAQFFPKGMVLTGEDWTQALDRMLLELTMAAATDTSEGLSDSVRLGLLFALNHHPLLDEPITDIEPNGNLVTESKTTTWAEL